MRSVGDVIVDRFRHQIDTFIAAASTARATAEGVRQCKLTMAAISAVWEAAARGAHGLALLDAILAASDEIEAFHRLIDARRPKPS
jgi:hypothetical protein